MKKIKLKKMSVFNWIIFAVLLIYALSMILLLCWGLVTSLKYQNEFRTNKLWFAKKPTFDNLILVFENFNVRVLKNGEEKFINIGMQFVYTLLYAGVGSFLMTLAPCMVAYVAVKFNKYLYSKILETVVIVAMILPIVGAYPSMIQVMDALNVYDTFWGLWMQKFNFTGIYFLTFMATYRSIPKEMGEAASIDGANEYRIFFNIILPLVMNMFFTVLLIHFVEMWNDYQVSLLYTPSYPTLARGVYAIANSTVPEFSVTPVRMASCMILVIPILVLFIAFRNKLMGNLSMGGVKE